MGDRVGRFSPPNLGPQSKLGFCGLLPFALWYPINIILLCSPHSTYSSLVLGLHSWLVPSMVWCTDTSISSPLCPSAIMQLILGIFRTLYLPPNRRTLTFSLTEADRYALQLSSLLISQQTSFCSSEITKILCQLLSKFMMHSKAETGRGNNLM